MTRVDFYILEPGSKYSRETVAYRLTDKAYQHGQQVYIQADNAEAAMRIDNDLWTFQAHSFIPHALASQAPSPQPPVVIGHEAPRHRCELMINLSRDLPEDYHSVSRIIEIVGLDATAKQRARERFRRYREAGCEVHTHHLNG